MNKGEKYIQATFGFYKKEHIIKHNERADVDEIKLPMESKKYSIAPFEGKYIGRCTQIAYSATPEDQEKNGLTEKDIFILVKTPIDPFESPSSTGVFFDLQHFEEADRVPLRVSSACLPGSLGDLQCNCHVESIEYIKEIGEKGVGVFVYMPQEALGRGLREKVRDHRLIFGIDDNGYRIPPMTEAEAMNTLHPEGYDKRAYYILKDVFHELGLDNIKYEFLGENERKRLELIDQTGLVINKKIEGKLVN